jgi:hypothetical protein
MLYLKLHKMDDNSDIKYVCSYIDETGKKCVRVLLFENYERTNFISKMSTLGYTKIKTRKMYGNRSVHKTKKYVEKNN